MMVKLIVMIKKIKIAMNRKIKEIIKKNNQNKIKIRQIKENQCLFYGIMVGFKMYWHG